MNAQAAISAMELYEAFGETEYLSRGVSFARILMACQASAVDPSFSIPLRGYFYENETHERIQTYYHRSYEHAPIKAFAMLYRLTPEHEDASPLEKLFGTLSGICSAHFTHGLTGCCPTVYMNWTIRIFRR